MKKDRNNILLQTMDASQKYAEQLRHAREITKNLEDLVKRYLSLLSKPTVKDPDDPEKSQTFIIQPLQIAKNHLSFRL